MLDIRQTPEYANYLSGVGWTVKRIGDINYFIRRLPLIGSIIKIQRPEKLDNKSVNQLINKHRAFQIIVEPKNRNQELGIKNKGFRRTKSPFLPSKTLCLDLTKSKEKLFAGLKKDCRQAIKSNNELRIKNYKQSLPLRGGENIKEFRASWKRAVGWRRYVPALSHLVALKKSFGKDALFLASVNSGAIFLVGDNVGYYWQAFTNKAGRKNQTQYKIVWEGILWAKKKGAKVFDFEGIYDGRFPNKSWLGFTHFKKSFGGYEVEYPGAFVKNLLPFKLWI